jgi:hypothetical protein
VLIVLAVTRGLHVSAYFSVALIAAAHSPSSSSSSAPSHSSTSGMLGKLYVCCGINIRHLWRLPGPFELVQGFIRHDIRAASASTAYYASNTG